MLRITVLLLMMMLWKTTLTDHLVGGQPVYNIPLGGYRLLEGGYYPPQLAAGLKPVLFDGGNLQGGYYPNAFAGALGYGGHRSPQYQTALIKPIIEEAALGSRPATLGFLPGAFGPHLRGYGGEESGKSGFSEAKQNANDERFEKGQGNKGEEANRGEAGFSQKEVASKDVKGDSGYYSNVDGGKKVIEDGREYSGGRHFDNEGRNGEEKTAKQGHKKGHKVKSFKTSHHKDESGTDEEYYDEAHDEGGNFAFKGETGKFGEKGASSFKGGHQEGKFNAEESKKEGHHSNEHEATEKEGNVGKFGGNKYAGNEAQFGYRNGADGQSLLGHQEGGKVYKTSPFIAPLHDHW